MYNRTVGTSKNLREVGISKLAGIIYQNIKEGWAHCFHMEVKMVVLNAIRQIYNKIYDLFEVTLVPYASLCLGNHLA